jgi:hypothetical protein
VDDDIEEAADHQAGDHRNDDEKRGMGVEGNLQHQEFRIPYSEFRAPTGSKSLSLKPDS